MTLKCRNNEMPGLRAPAFLFARAAFLSATAALSLAVAAPAQAQQAPGSVQAPVASFPVPDQLEMSKLIWSTMLLVDHANKSGNYSVLRDMSSQGFQINNDAARLAQIFASLRQSRVDLSNTLVLAPLYTEQPKQLRADVFEVKGVFQLRPTAIQFDLFFQWEQGRWKPFGMDIQPFTMAQGTPSPQPPQQAAPPPRKR
ncbi:hypothetical protein [Tsuneonella amylolytica]|uniref:hypothetical protein n=1 Tax=Tsuneonella amylolytica TaxID=2338327 RepID=UPI001892AB6E|nr:hypothetical protein [Tsuneonella amylolytica]